MRTESIISDKLKMFDYYKNKLPMYLQQSFGFIEHFRIWYEILVGDNNNGVIGASDTLLNLLNIFDKDYLTWCEEHITDFHSTSNVSDILDKLGNLFGVTRNLKVTYYDYVDEQDKTEQLSLTNEDFLVLIKCQIIKNYCEGTTEQINEYYDNVGIQLYVVTAETPATANLYLVKNDARPDLTKLFLAGLLQIESVGVQYTPSLLSLAAGIWDVSNWDEGEWDI